MHIAFVLPSLHGGGAEFVVRQWLSVLSNDGHEVTVYVYARDQPRVAIPQGTAVHTYPGHWGSMRLVFMPAWLRIRIRRDTPDVVVSLLPFSNVISLIAMRVGVHSEVTLMISERNVPSLQVDNTKRRDQVTAWLARRLYRRANGALAISHPVATNLVSTFGVRPERVFVVPNPVVLSPDPAIDTPGPPPGDLHVVFVGRQVKQKRPQLFLHVLAELSSREITVRGTVIGDGPLRESTELESKRLGLSVSFLGWKEPWWGAVDNVDCLLLTANVEGFANVLVEAAAAGIPSVASSRALGVADAIVPGITGELAMEDSPQAYAEAILRAALLDPGSTADLRSWFARFSTARSTSSLLAALQAVRGPVQS
ncbi:MAG TPA: glycosyltransferase [Solirubrobacteraceae bacterium]|jgi:glycosyltransferase involved in cell wall biosynthesis|nr:glycosyltransferase [Solirubrobacteraceae bacterium]